MSSGFWQTLIINKLKKGNEADNLGVEAAATSTSLPSDASEQPEQLVKALGTQNISNKVCFVCIEIRPHDSNAYNKGGWGVCEYKSAGDRLMDAANAISETNDLYVAKQRLIIHISAESKDIFSRNKIPPILLESIYLQKL